MIKKAAVFCLVLFIGGAIFGCAKVAETGNAAQIATALGHSENVLRKNYMALVTKNEAQAFWRLKPQPAKQAA